MDFRRLGQVGNPQGVRGGEPQTIRLPFQLPTNIENTLGYAPPSHAPRRPPSHTRAIRRPTAIAFATVSASSTSLARSFSHFNGAAPPSPPSHAKARRRWSFLAFSLVPLPLHLPRLQSEPDVDSCLLHFPHMQMLAEGGFSAHFDALAASSTSLACKTSRRNMAIRATTTSLACNSELEVVFIRCFNAVSPTSPACNSEPEVVFIWRFDAVRATTDVESPDYPS
jgi:hypothetical protein